MKVLITGGAGFIGSSVTDSLLELGHQVLIIDNYETGVKNNNKGHSNLKIVEGSITNEGLLNSAFSDFKPEVVLHAAASYKDPDNWQNDISTNITGTINIAKYCRLTNVKRLIYLQTSLCYGLNPIESPISIGHPLLSGGSSYAISKTSAELYLELSKIEFVSLRLANIYGPRNLSGPLPTFYQRLSNNLECQITNTRRDFVFIDDVVSVIKNTISGQGKDKYYHISTGRDHSILELFQLAKTYLGKTSTSVIIQKEMGADDVQTILLDPSKTKKDFFWQPLVSLEEGVSRTMQWYKANSEFNTNTHLKNFKY